MAHCSSPPGAGSQCPIGSLAPECVVAAGGVRNEFAEEALPVETGRQLRREKRASERAQRRAYRRKAGPTSRHEDSVIYLRRVARPAAGQPSFSTWSPAVGTSPRQRPPGLCRIAFAATRSSVIFAPRDALVARTRASTTRSETNAIIWVVRTLRAPTGAECCLPGTRMSPLKGHTAKISGYQATAVGTESMRLSCPSGGELDVAGPRNRLLSAGFGVV